LKNFQMTGSVLFVERQKTNLKKLYKVFNCVFNNISYSGNRSDDFKR
jgi:hypothetical protein